MQTKLRIYSEYSEYSDTSLMTDFYYCLRHLFVSLNFWGASDDQVIPNIRAYDCVWYKFNIYSTTLKYYIT
jgi:hypothetical protein